MSLQKFKVLKQFRHRLYMYLFLIIQLLFLHVREFYYKIICAHLYEGQRYTCSYNLAVFRIESASSPTVYGNLTTFHKFFQRRSYR